MQLSFDWMRRERCAARTETSLAEIDVPDVQRAVIWLLLTHPDARVIDREEKVVALSITYQQAGDWLRSNVARWQTLRLGRSSVRRAVGVWERLGIMSTRGGRPTTLLVHFGRLGSWHQAEEEERQRSIEEWAKAQFVSCCVPKAQFVSPQNDRLSDVVSLSSEDNKEPHSITHSGAVPNAGELPPLPEEVFDEQLQGQSLLQAVHAWWVSEGLRDRGFDPRTVIGALLAARDRAQSNPQGFVRACLRGRVQRQYLEQATALMRPHTSAGQRPYSPHGLPE